MAPVRRTRQVPAHTLWLDMYTEYGNIEGMSNNPDLVKITTEHGTFPLAPTERVWLMTGHVPKSAVPRPDRAT